MTALLPTQTENSTQIKNLSKQMCRFFLLLSFFMFHPSYADFNLGMQYYEAGDFERAQKEFMQVAQLGDSAAQFNLGAMHFRGEYFEKDLIKSYAWFALAAEKHSPEEKSPHQGLYAKMSQEEQLAAEKAYQALSEEYSEVAIEQRLLPHLSMSEAMVKKMRISKQTVPKYPRVSGLRNPNGIVDVLFTVDKNGTTRDHVIHYSSNKAFEREAIRALRQWRYEPTLVHGKPVDVNGVKQRIVFQLAGTTFDQGKIDRATTEMREKALNGNDSDKLAFAFFIEAVNSQTSMIQNENSNTWYIEAANSGNAIASYFLGRNILYGDMCSADSAKSMSWLLKAAQKNVSDAQYMLALESFSGVYFDKDEEKGFYWLKRAAHGSDTAKLRLAWLMATHPNPARRAGADAASLIEEVSKNYYDQQTYLQTKAAVAAETGDFKSALSWAKKAKKDAKSLELPVQNIDAQITNYANNQAWREVL